MSGGQEIERSNGAGVGAGIVRREGVGGSEIARSGDTASAASAARAQANVLARFQVARMTPRDVDDVRVRVLKECRRPGFAEVARYSLPRGGKRIEGPTIRFAEACARHMGNIEIDTPVSFEDAEKRIVSVTATDLETNTTYRAEVVIQKFVERREANPAEVIGSRQNAQGQTVYLVAASDDALLQKQGALVSKSIRTLVLRLVPGDIIDEAQELVISTLRNGIDADPDAARKKMIDAFAGLGVTPVMLAKHVGHEIATCSPSEVGDLRSLYTAIKEGETSWAEATRPAKPTAEGEEPAPSSRTNRVKAAAASKAAASKAPAPARDYDPTEQDAPPPDDADPPHE